MARLILDRGGHTQEYELRERTTLGRSSKNDIRVPEGKASRQHAVILHKGGSYVVEDSKSSNGTFVNNIRTHSICLNHGDVIRIGKSHFTFSDVIDDPLVGTEIGNYKIHERLGMGGMGTVYRATQVTMDRDVALKVMRPEFVTSNDFIKDFMREARLAGRLQHVNIIGIHDFGEADAKYFFSMEYVKGENLNDRIERTGRIRPDVALKITRQMAMALAHAHDNGIIHHDIKPENIMLTQNDTVKVADLGLAKVMSYGTQVESDRPAMGTPQYVAPEIIKREAVSPCTDIYSMGATIYHMMVGTPPYGGETPTELVRQHLLAPIPVPHEVQPTIPPAFSDFIVKCLQKEPADRYKNCHEVLKALMEVEKSLTAPVAATAAPALSAKPQQKKKSQPKAPVKAVAAAPAMDNRPGDSAEHSVQQTATDELPTTNPWRPVAIGIFVAGSAIVTVILCYAIWILVKGGGVSPGAAGLKEAQQHMDAGDFSRAEQTLMHLRLNHPESPEAAEAVPMLETVRRELQQRARLPREFSTIRQEYREKTITAAQAMERLNRLLQDPDADELLRNRAELFKSALEGELPAATDDGAPETPSEDPREVAATEAWKSAAPVISAEIGDNKLTSALELLDSFIRNHENTNAAKSAETIRNTTRERLANAGKKLVEQALAQRDEGNLADAMKILAQASTEFPNGPWGQKAVEELRNLDRQTRTRYFDLWGKVRKDLKSFEALQHRADAQKTATQLAGLPWGEAAADLAQELNHLKAFRNQLLERLVQAEHATVTNMGQAKLERGEENTLTASRDGKTYRVPYETVWLEDITRLAPAKDLSDSERAGAALYALGRGHLGYMRTYLGATSPAFKRTRLFRNLLAQRKDRVAVDVSDFSDPVQNQSWKVEAGSWRFEKGALQSPGNEPSRIRLDNRIYGFSNIAATIQAESTGGQCAILFGRDEFHYVALRKTATELIVEFSNGPGAPSTARTGLSDPTIPVRLELAENEAAAAVGNRILARLPAPGTDQWFGQLHLEVNGGAGSFDNLVMEQGK